MDESPRSQVALLTCGADHQQAGRFAEALAAYEQAVARAPLDARAWLGKGLALWSLHIYTFCLWQREDDYRT